MVVMSRVNFYIPSEQICFIDLSSGHLTTSEFNFSIDRDEKSQAYSLYMADESGIIAMRKLPNVWHKQIRDIISSHAKSAIFLIHSTLIPFKNEMLTSYTVATNSTPFGEVMENARGYLLDDKDILGFFDPGNIHTVPYLKWIHPGRESFVSVEDVLLCDNKERIYSHGKRTVIVLMYDKHILHITTEYNGKVFRIIQIIPYDTMYNQKMYEKGMNASSIMQIYQSSRNTLIKNIFNKTKKGVNT